MGLQFGDANQKTCHICQAMFPSRNALYKYLRLENHHWDADGPHIVSLHLNEDEDFSTSTWYEIIGPLFKQTAHTDGRTAVSTNSTYGWTDGWV